MNNKNIIREYDFEYSIIKKYNHTGPRYTSYPTILELKDNYIYNDFIIAASSYTNRLLILYVHIPFCYKLYYFCACNKVVTRHKHNIDHYLLILEKKIIKQSRLFSHRTVIQMHWWRWNSNIFGSYQLSKLMEILKSYFNFAVNAEISIEIDPRKIELHIIDHLKCEGFKRLSIGIQDFNKEVCNT